MAPEEAYDRIVEAIFADPPDVIATLLGLEEFTCNDGSGSFTVVLENRNGGPWSVSEGTGAYSDVSMSGTIEVERLPVDDPDSPLADAATRAYEGASRGWDDLAPSKALDATWSLVRATNAYLETNEPWKTEPGAAVDAVMGDALEALRIVSVLAFPAVPRTAQEIWERIGLTSDISEQRLPSAAACRTPPRPCADAPPPSRGRPPEAPAGRESR